MQNRFTMDDSTVAVMRMMSIGGVQPASTGSSVPLVRHMSESSISKAFDISELTKTQLTVTRCWYYRSGLTKRTAYTPTVALSGTERYIAAQINTLTGEVTLVADASETAAFDVTIPTDSQNVKYPLYKLTRAVDTDDWTVEEDYRAMPTLPLYL